MENKDKKYHSQVLLEQCLYKLFSSRSCFLIEILLINPNLAFTDTESDCEPDDNDESEEEINENTVFDE